jgi:SAM-dependent methyltransferase
MKSIVLGESATFSNFNETGYLLANLDVQKAVNQGKYRTGFEHFKIFGNKENRIIYSMENLQLLKNLRNDKFERISGKLRNDLDHDFVNGKHNYLTKELRNAFRIIDTDNVSANRYDEAILNIINQYANGLILDCGAGLRDIYYSNVFNYEIADYVTTDIVGVGEVLPFEDETFDAVISIAVLEHVKDPFRCASEISRVLKKGGILISCIPFLQPYHGYPHHYYNMTYQGHENLYNNSINIKEICVLESMKPIHTLTWFLQKYVNGLQTNEAREKFGNMKIQDLMATPESFLNSQIVTDLDKTAEMELASATFLKGVKK